MIQLILIIIINIRVVPGYLFSRVFFFHLLLKNSFDIFKVCFTLNNLRIQVSYFFVKGDDDQTCSASSTNILAYLFLLADILHNYTNSLTLSSILLMKSKISKPFYVE
jgi:hypothetical protein